MFTLIIIIIITNNEFLSKLFNFQKLNNKDIKFKILFYILFYLLFKIKKILYIYIFIFIIFIFIYLYKILITKKYIKIKPIIKNTNNILFLISSITYMIIYKLSLKKKNYKLLFLIFIKFLPNILLSLSILFLNITYMLTYIIYYIRSYSSLKLIYFNYLFKYDTMIDNNFFYGMKNINKKLLYKIKEANVKEKISDNDTLNQIVHLKSQNYNGEILYHPAQSYNINNEEVFLNSITHKSVNKFTPCHNHDKNTKMEAIIANKDDIFKYPEKKYDLLIERLNIKKYPAYKDYLYKIKSYNENLITQKDTIILNQTGNSKYIKLDDYINKLSVDNILKITNINAEGYHYVENLIKKYEPNFNKNIENKSEQIAIIIKIINEANNLL